MKKLRQKIVFLKVQNDQLQMSNYRLLDNCIEIGLELKGINLNFLENEYQCH